MKIAAVKISGVNIACAALLSATIMTPALAETAFVTPVLTVPLEAEITGLTTSPQGDLFVNFQHPNADLGNAFAKAGVGVIANPDYSGELGLPRGDEKKVVKSALGEYQLLLSAGDNGIGDIDGKTSDSPDFNSFIATGEMTGYLFTNWEERPGGMSRIALARSEDGQWSLTAAEMLDFTSVGGTWVNCFGSTSPWNTPLSAEELYFDDTAQWNNPNFEEFASTRALADHLGHFPNPYRLGYIVEITDPTGTPTPVKHFAMGRYSHENGFVMPDQKTVYLSDDGTDVVFFKFVADKAGELSAGTLYAAKFIQAGAPGIDVNDAKFSIEWIELAHGNQAEIEAWVGEYDAVTPEDYVDGATSYISDAEIAKWAAGEAVDDRVAFLESRKAAKAKGATAEFRKMEGVAYDGANVFVAMTEITKGMADEVGDVQLAANPCGAVFKIDVDGEYNATAMSAWVVGGPYDEAAAPNACATDAISSPDNILALEPGVLLIGEDSGEHENNTLWLAR